MKLRRNNANLLIEPPSCATGDIAFNLIVFFLVCASTPSNSGRKQDVPKSDKTEQTEQKENITVDLTRTVVKVNGDPFRADQRGEILSTLRRLLESKTQQQDKIVIVKSSKDAPYHQWISVTELIEEAGGIITLQLEEERVEAVN